MQNNKNSAAASMMGAWNDTVAVENGWISKTKNPSQNKTTDKSQNLGRPILLGGDQTIQWQLARYHVLL